MIATNPFKKPVAPTTKPLQQTTPTAPTKPTVAPAVVTSAKGRPSTIEFFRLLLYGPTSSRRSTTAAHFGSPAEVKFVLTRAPEQLIPIESEGYQYHYCRELGQALAALKNPEKFFDAGWAGNKNRTLVLDDATALRDWIGFNETTSDERRLAKVEKDELYEVLCRAAMTQAQNFICIAAEDSWDEKTLAKHTHVEAALPKKFREVQAKLDFEYCFYSAGEQSSITSLLNPNKFKLLTEPLTLTESHTNDKNETLAHNTYIFAKHKVPYKALGQKLISTWEPQDLRQIWSRIQTGRRDK